MMLPVCFEAVLSVYAPAEASARCLGFQAMESTNGCWPLTGTVQGFLPAWTTLSTTQSMACLVIMPLQWFNFMWQHDTHALAHFIDECTDAHSYSGPQSQALDQPWVSTNDEVISLTITRHSERGVRELMMELRQCPLAEV